MWPFDLMRSGVGSCPECAHDDVVRSDAVASATDTSASKATNSRCQSLADRWADGCTGARVALRHSS